MKKIIAMFCLLAITAFFRNTDLNWKLIEHKAKGQTVYFHAWGGSLKINNYLRWVNTRLNAEYDVTLKHVKVNDIENLITSLITEKKAKTRSAIPVDMVWINGKNFKLMKQYRLLGKPFATQLPNWKFVNKSFPVDIDFTEPTLGLEAPWGIGQLVFIYDKNRIETPPGSFFEMLSYAKMTPNRLSYPKPPSFHGSSFLKAALIELSEDSKPLYQAVDAETFQQISAPLWAYLDEFHNVAWHQGKEFPESHAQMIKLLNNGALDLAVSFNPNEVNSAQANGSLRPSTELYALKAGALTNIHFLSIPWNANAREGALVAINFMLSPEAQSRKGDFAIWGDPTILQLKYITGTAKKSKLFKAISEPHPSWQTALDTEWQNRYGY